MWRTVQRALVIIMIGVALGLAANAVSPRRIPYVTPPKPKLEPKDTLTLEEAKALWDAGTAFFLDARAPADYAAGHVANAFSLHIDEFDQYFPQVAGMLTPETVIVTYCDGQECELSHRLTARLRELGFHNVRVLVNGWTVWHTAGLPTKTGDEP